MRDFFNIYLIFVNKLKNNLKPRYCDVTFHTNICMIILKNIKDKRALKYY